MEINIRVEYLLAVGAMFVGLKLIGLVTLSWLWVLSPFIIFAIFIVVFALIGNTEIVFEFDKDKD